MIKGSFVEKLRVTESERSPEIIVSSWHERSLARKLRFHILNFWNLTEASHESWMWYGASAGEKSRLARAVVGVAAVAWKCSPSARAVELRAPGDVSLLRGSCTIVVCMCWGTLCVGIAALKRCAHIFNFWDLNDASHKSFVFTSSSLGIWRMPRTKASLSQILEWLNVMIWTKHCVFFRVNGASAGEKSRLARARW